MDTAMWATGLASAAFFVSHLGLAHPPVHLSLIHIYGLQLALETSVRALAAVSCLSFLTLTTPLADLIPLVRRAGVPAGIIELILLIYRCLLYTSRCV